MPSSSKNPYVRARKSAAVASRLAVKPPGVKGGRGSAARRLARRRGPKGSDDPVATRASRTPRLGLPKGELLAETPSTYVGRLSTVSDWARQISKIYREMRRHQIPPDLGTKLTFVANAGASVCRWIEESMPKDVHVPPDLSRLDDKELEQLEFLLAKAAGPKALEQLTQSIAPGGDADD
jgi:hypothetical protein